MSWEEQPDSWRRTTRLGHEPLKQIPEWPGAYLEGPGSQQQQQPPQEQPRTLTIKLGVSQRNGIKQQEVEIWVAGGSLCPTQPLPSNVGIQNSSQSPLLPPMVLALHSCGPQDVVLLPQEDVSEAPTSLVTLLEQSGQSLTVLTDPDILAQFKMVWGHGQIQGQSYVQRI